jgi:phage shock protein A
MLDSRRITTMEETLQTLGERMDRGFEQLGERFKQVDQRFEQVDQRFDELDKNIDAKLDAKLGALESKLLIKIEEVGKTVKLIFDKVTDFDEKHTATRKAYKRFNRTLSNHDLRLKALEHAPEQSSEKSLRSGPALVRRRKQSK